jgi:acyl-CoA reductase-like NAD-dependent aldehyde dehydrogenase
VTDVTIDDSLMSEEVFGPIMPVMRYDTIDEACRRIAHISKEPLGLYVMSEDQNDFDYVLEHTISGGVSLNDTMTQIAVPNLPFGGFGGSGMGAYHGKMSIDTFSHRRSVVQVPKEAEEAFEWRYPTGNQQEKFEFYKANLEAKL